MTDPKDPKKKFSNQFMNKTPLTNTKPTDPLTFLQKNVITGETIKPKVNKKPLMVVDNLFGPMKKVKEMDEERRKGGGDDGYTYVKKIELGKEKYKGERKKYVKYDNLVEKNPKKKINFDSLLKNADNVHDFNVDKMKYDITPTGGGAAKAFVEHYNHPITRQRLKEQIPGIDDERIDNMLIKGLKAEKHSGGIPDNADGAYGSFGGKDKIFFRESHLNNKSTDLHERVHASKMDDPLGVKLQEILGTDAGPIGRDGGYNPIETRRYLNKPGETYGNFAGFRQELGMKPGEQIDEKRMRQIMKDKKIESNFSNTYDDTKIVKALNTMASTDTKKDMLKKYKYRLT
jgi:hypothetical protein